MNELPKTPPGPSHDDGFALVAVLFAGLLLALLAAGFASAVRAKLRATAAQVETARAQGLADAAINIVLLDTVNSRAASAGRFPHNGSAVVCTMENASVIVELQDDEGKVNLNSAPSELLAALFEGLGAGATDAKMFAARIVDFRDGDDEPSDGGAERADYAKAGYAHGPANAEFSSVSELDQVLGVPLAIAAQAKPYLTTAMAHTGVDTAVAPKELREVLGRGTSAFVRNATSSDSNSIFADGGLPESMKWQSSRQAYTVRATATLQGGTRYTSETAFTLQPNGQPLLRYWHRGIAQASPTASATNIGPC